MTTKRKKQYVVANPRGIPAGRHVLRIGDRLYFAGDEYDGPLTAGGDPHRFVRDGFVEVVSGG